MTSSIDVGIGVPYNNLLFVLVDAGHEDLRQSIKTLLYLVLRLCTDWHVYDVYLCIAYL